MNAIAALAMIFAAVVAITAIAVGLVLRAARATGTISVLLGTGLAPVLWLLWGGSFFFTGTPSSDHDETLVYVGASALMAALTLPVTFATSLVTLHLLRRIR